MNDLSSRSHTIFRVVIESKKQSSPSSSTSSTSTSTSSSTHHSHNHSNSHNHTHSHNNSHNNSRSKEKVRVSVLNFIDLAGSERLTQTGCEGLQQKEGMAINKSLMFLGVVISRLSEGER